jgi:predicted enzyme related to lactoylglutathione lyase
MSTKLIHVVIDANDPSRLARFWAEALDWQIVIEERHEVEIEGGSEDLNLIFVPVSEPKTAKSRVHLDLCTRFQEGQSEKVDRLIDRGASRVDIGQRSRPWVVLADPEGNEFCVLPPNYYQEETGPVAAICITPENPDSLTEFWSAATGWPKTRRGLHRGTGPHIVFGGGVPAPKMAKNRVHLDIAPFVGGDQHEEAERLVAVGARRIDIGQGDVPWLVMADPEGNEFCILSPR